nr:uncharacterized protein LOC123775240 [Procambarus clarkii]
MCNKGDRNRNEKGIVMQANVPKPYGISGKVPVHLNMLGGQWAQDDKYVSGDLLDHHHSTIILKKNPGTALITFGSLGLGSLVKRVALLKLSGLDYRGLETVCGNSRIDYLNSRRFSSCTNNCRSAVDLNTVRAAGAATFVVAYAVHKVFAPARIAITLTATPFIVRHLRKIGFLKPPKPKAS